MTQEEPNSKKVVVEVKTGASQLFTLILLMWWVAGIVVSPWVVPKIASVVIPPVGLYFAMEKALCVGNVIACGK